MRHGLLKLGNEQTRVDIELDALRAMQLAPEQYELILLDTVMDAMDGLQLLQLIKQQAPTSKFIVVSDSADETSRAVAYQNGADFFLARPLTPAAVGLAVEAIRGLLTSRVEERVRDEGETPVVRLADIVQMRCLSGDSVLLLVRSNTRAATFLFSAGKFSMRNIPARAVRPLSGTCSSGMAGWCG